MDPEKELILVSICAAILESGDRARSFTARQPQDYVHRAGTLITCAADAIAAKRGTAPRREAANG